MHVTVRAVRTAARNGRPAKVELFTFVLIPQNQLQRDTEEMVHVAVMLEDIGQRAVHALLLAEQKTKTLTARVEEAELTGAQLCVLDLTKGLPVNSMSAADEAARVRMRALIIKEKRANNPRGEA